MTNNFNTIQNTLIQALEETNYSTQIQFLIDTKNQLDTYLNEFLAVTKNIANDIEQNVQLGEGESESTKKYRAIRQAQKHNPIILNYLLQGYIYIDEIRTALTGQEIVYQVGIPYRGKLYEGTVTLQDIIENSTLAIESTDNLNNINKIRLKKGSLRSKIVNSMESEITKVTEEASSVYSAVFNYMTDSLHKIPKVNKGNAYEAYRQIVAARNGQNEVPPEVTVETIEDAFNMVLKNTAASYQGGDIGTIQVKYFGGAAPSLVSTATILDVLPKVSNFLNDIINGSRPKGEIADGFTKLFTKKESELVNDIELSANQEAINNLRANFKALGLM